jgi:tRNA 2-thiouridine synthesizing protein E
MKQFATDKEGFLQELTDWNPETAADLADYEGINLDEEHWLVITALRHFYQKTEISPAMRPFVKLVKTQVSAELGSSIALMNLFGPSPAKTAAKIAGLPKPTNCI